MTKQPTYLAAAIWTPANFAHELRLILAGSLFIALTAQIEIPMWPVPVTGQTFGVLLVGALLGRRGALSVIAYLIEGAIGLPFFAGGAAGPQVLAGPTGGYLAGFVVAAFIIGWLCEKGWDARVGTAVIAMLIANLTIYAFGLPWLAQFVGWDSVLSAGLLPFIPGDLIKVILTALALPFGWRLVNKSA